MSAEPDLSLTSEEWTEFRVGLGVGLVSPSTLAILEPSNGVLADEMWALVEGGAGVDELLEALSATGLRSLGSFAMAQFEADAVRVVLRGAATADLMSDLGISRFDAVGVRTWTESVVEGAAGVVLRLYADDAQRPPGPFRLRAGLVPADALTRGGASLSSIQNADFAGVESFDVASVVTGPSKIDPQATQQPAIAAPLTTPAIASPLPTPTQESDLGDTGATMSFDMDRTMTLSALTRHLAIGAAPGPDGAEPLPEPDRSVEVSPGASEPHTGTAAIDEYDFDEIFGRTRARSVEAAAVVAVQEPLLHDDRPVDKPASPTSPTASFIEPPGQPVERSATPRAAESGLIVGIPHADAPAPGTPRPAADRVSEPFSALGDHDGQTMSKAQLDALRSGHHASPTPAAPQPALGGPSLQAVLCSSGHGNPPHLAACQRCGVALTGDPVVIARPVLGVLRFSGGQQVLLDRPVLIGRKPKLEGRMPGEVPQLLKLDVGQGLSRTHAIVRLEGWQVLLEDLNSANGTVVTQPGMAPRRLHAGEPSMLEYGAQIDFGGEITASFGPS